MVSSSDTEERDGERAGALKGAFIGRFTTFSSFVRRQRLAVICSFVLYRSLAAVAAESYARRKKGRVATREIDTASASTIREATGWHLTLRFRSDNTHPLFLFLSPRSPNDKTLDAEYNLLRRYSMLRFHQYHHRLALCVRAVINSRSMNIY